MNLRHLETFIAVIDAGGFTAAARRLGTSQPTVSATVRRLESELGATVFLRDSRNIELTAAGTVFARHARSVLAQIAASRRDVTALRDKRSGHIRLGAPPMVLGALLPGAIASFMAERPGMRLTITQTGAEQIREQVMCAQLDLGIVAEGPAADGLESRMLSTHPIVACAATSNPLASRPSISWEELLDQPLIAFPATFYQRLRIEEAAQSRGRRPRIVLETDSVAVMLEAVRRNVGIATLLAAVARGEPHIATIALPHDASVAIALCHRSDVPMSNAAAALHTHLCRPAADYL